MEIPKIERETIFNDLVPIFKLAISQPLVYVKRYLVSVPAYRFRSKPYLVLFEPTDT